MRWHPNPPSLRSRNELPPSRDKTTNLLLDAALGRPCDPGPHALNSEFLAAQEARQVEAWPLRTRDDLTSARSCRKQSISFNFQRSRRAHLVLDRGPVCPVAAGKRVWEALRQHKLERDVITPRSRHDAPFSQRLRLLQRLCQRTLTDPRVQFVARKSLIVPMPFHDHRKTGSALRRGWTGGCGGSTRTDG